MKSVEVNPYAPPENVAVPKWSLPPDTEFLFNDEQLASVGTVELPRVCVLTGDATELRSMNSELTATPRFYRTSFRIAPFITVILLLNSLDVPSTTAASIYYIAALLFAMATLLLLVVGIRRRRRLQLRWYLSDRASEKIRKETLYWRIVYAVLGLAFLLYAYVMRLHVDATVIVALVLTGFVAKILKRPEILRATNVYRGLVVVEGFKPPFVAELRRMAERYQSGVAE